MQQDFFISNRKALYDTLPAGSLVVLFSGHAPRKTADEMYPFFADRSFVYFTGITQERTVLLAKVGEDSAEECMYILPPDLHAERWTGERIKAAQVEEISGIRECRNVEHFTDEFRRMAYSGDFSYLCLDFDQLDTAEPWRDAMKLSNKSKEYFPYLHQINLHPQICRMRSVKKLCEIAAMKHAEEITRDGILAMMRASRPGLYEYQYKAEWDHALAQHGVLSPAFPSIISAGQNNFCIHYYAYRGQAQDGELVLNDVGAIWDFLCTDVSRAWPVNGRFSDRQRALYECAYATSNHMFEILKPGYTTREVDRMVHEYCGGLLRDIGALRPDEPVEKLMWHGGAHQVGFDVHDVCDYSKPVQPGYVFCVDVGIYHEEWGIGFRLEDNCLITEDGCENLSAVTPRAIEDIEAYMGRR